MRSRPLANTSPAIKSRCCKASGSHPPLPDDLGSNVVIGNGIHNFGADEKPALFKETFRVIRHGAGLFFK